MTRVMKMITQQMIKLITIKIGGRNLLLQKNCILLIQLNKQQPNFLPTKKLGNDQQYYVHMHQNPIVIEEHPKEINVVSLDEHSPMVLQETQTSIKYLNTLRKKTMDKAIIKQFKQGRQKEREDK